MPRGCDQGIQEAFASQVVLGHPCQPLLADRLVLQQQPDFGSLGPKLRKLDGIPYGERLGKATGMGCDMDKFSGNPRVLGDGPSDEEAGIDTDHLRIRGQGSHPACLHG